MTRDEIIATAREAGFVLADNATDEAVGRFRRLVDLAAEAERAACAQLVEKNADVCGANTMLCDVLRGNAVAIRARGNVCS